MSELQRCYRHPNRETAVSCSECGRPICPDCMVFAPVGIRCPEHGRGERAPLRPVQGARRTIRAGDPTLVTKALIAINVLVYLVELGAGANVNGIGGTIWEHGVLYGPLVARGDWWRLITSAFLHYGLIHLATNMLSLWFVGAAIEQALGRGRYLLLYFASGLAGAAGALLVDPTQPTLGASGAIFGILGAWLVLEWHATGSFVGQAFTWITINLVISFVLPNISWGGHVGGLVGGILCTLGFTRFGRGHPSYGRLALPVASAVAVGAASVVVAYLKVRGYG